MSGIPIRVFFRCAHMLCLFYRLAAFASHDETNQQSLYINEGEDSVGVAVAVWMVRPLETGVGFNNQ